MKKWNALIVLLALALSVVAPPSLPWLANPGGESEIGTLDLCHSTAPGLSAGIDMPCISECPGHYAPLAIPSPHEVPSVALKSLLIAFQDERPPQA